MAKPFEVIVTYQGRPDYELEGKVTETMMSQGYILMAKGMDFQTGERALEYYLAEERTEEDNP